MSRTVIFLHIPKTGGQTLDHIIGRQYPSAATYKISSQQSIDQLRSLPEEEKRKIQYLKGHMPFGLHQWLPGPYTYLALLRNPVERAISEYYYVRQSINHPFHQELIERGLSLDDYIKTQLESGETNLQTRWISGLVAMNKIMPPYDRLQPDALTVAKQNIRAHFSVVGVTEHFDKTLLLVGKVFGWANLFYEKKNVNVNRPAQNKIPVQTVRLIEEHNQSDMELWAFVTQRLDTMLKEYGVSPLKLFLFRALNERRGLYKIYRSGRNAFYKVMNSNTSNQKG